MREINANGTMPSRTIFDELAVEGCYFLVPQYYRGMIDAMMNYSHGYQFVFDKRVRDIEVVDARTHRVHAVITGLAIPPIAL